MPVQRCQSAQPITVSESLRCSGARTRVYTIVLSPAAEVLVEVEAGCAVSELDVGEPFRDYVEEGGIQANSRAYKRDDDPSLRGIVRFPQPVSPVKAGGSVKVAGVAPAPSFPQLLSSRILYPV